MTTATPGYRTTMVGPVVRRALAATALVGLAAVIAGALVAGSPAAVGAVIGAAMVAGFFGFGALVLDFVARLVPALSLLVALLTYTLKVVLIGVVFLALTRSGSLEDAVDAGWLGGTVIVCTVVWLTVQVAVSVRARQPLYDLPEQPHGDGEEASAR